MQLRQSGLFSYAERYQARQDIAAEAIRPYREDATIAITICTALMFALAAKDYGVVAMIAASVVGGVMVHACSPVLIDVGRKAYASTL